MESLKVVKRTGDVVDFDDSKIRNAILKAVKAAGTDVPNDIIDELVKAIDTEIDYRFIELYPNIENIQDIVEKWLVKKGLYEIAKAYILYREKRQKAREERKKEDIEKAMLGKLTVKKRNGKTVLFSIEKLKESIERKAEGFEKEISVDHIAAETIKNIYDGIKTEDIDKALILATVSFIERDPAYSKVASRLFLQRLCKEVLGESATEETKEKLYREAFVNGIQKGIEKGIFDRRLSEFDLNKLAQSLMLDRDGLFEYIGIQTLYERYFTKIGDNRIELPQSFWMRVAMGLAIDEKDKEAKALEFYELISSMRYIPSTPTLFHAGLKRPQLSSCYLTMVEDDLQHIFKCISDNAQLSKWSGGLGNDWSNIRATGAQIKSTNVESQGVIPFLKIANDTTMAINRSGKRRGATCAYLETWHLDIEDFLDLRKNTGDERRRTHDMNTANWVPDLFMKRVINNENWTLFSPDEVPELHHLYGKKFEERYKEYEEKTQKGEIDKYKVVEAQKLWRKMISMLFETGHPWITFKDPCNIRSPQDHCGVIHSSNLCTEITLNTSKDETAVCNLGSINLEKHIVDKKLDTASLATTTKMAMRMLDNVIDINYYPTIEARNSNLKHRPVGLGIMGLQDALFKLDVSFESSEALKFSDTVMEFISYHAIRASSELAKERGAYQSYKGSKWDRGLLPQDTLKLLEEERGMKLEIPEGTVMDWTPVREHIKRYGMRNSNCMAIAPTATISNIAGCYPCIEPIYKNIYVKSNISGEFTIVNSYLVEDLKRLDLWNQEMLEQIKYHDGNLQYITAIPQHLKDKYKEVFDIDPEWLITLTAARAKWIDQSQSHNVFLNGVSGRKLNDIYIQAWRSGLKTTYYLRTLAASQIEKATLDTKYGFTQKREQPVETPTIIEEQIAEPMPKVCAMLDPECEACQ